MAKFVEPAPAPIPKSPPARSWSWPSLLTPTQKDGRIYIEKINAPMLYEHKADPAEYWAGLQAAIGKGWIEYHESGTCVYLTQAGKDLFA
jgi:hypothetical protein